MRTRPYLRRLSWNRTYGRRLLVEVETRIRSMGLSADRDDRLGAADIILCVHSHRGNERQGHALVSLRADHRRNDCVISLRWSRELGRW